VKFRFCRIRRAPAPLPYKTAPVQPVPAGWQAAFARLDLESTARVLIVPVPLISQTPAMRWQADTGEPRTLAGGYFVTASPTGQAIFSIAPRPTPPST
jgi:hypothetical protein